MKYTGYNVIRNKLHTYIHILCMSSPHIDVRVIPVNYMMILLFQTCPPQHYYFFHHTLMRGLHQISINTHVCYPVDFCRLFFLLKPLHTWKRIFKCFRSTWKWWKWKRGEGGQYLLKCLKGKEMKVLNEPGEHYQ